MDPFAQFLHRRSLPLALLVGVVVGVGALNFAAAVDCLLYVLQQIPDLFNIVLV